MKQNENNFEALRQLLALKQREMPPQGYFENFSGEVMGRIRMGEGARNAEFMDDMADKVPWLFQLLSMFEAKPAFAGVFASGLCALLLTGIVFAERPDVAPKVLLQPDQPGSSLAVAAPVAIPVDQPTADQAAAGQAETAFVSSTNPVFSSQSTPSWFGGQPASAQQVNFSQSGN